MSLLPPGSSIGDHILVRHAATGATSEVYEGRDPRTGNPVAVKRLAPEHLGEPELVARFLNEGQEIQGLAHAHLVKVFARGLLSDGTPYMVLEWVPATLHDLLSRPPPPVATVLRLVQQLAEVLDALHAHGLVHRDLKPSNVLLEGDEASGWKVKLADLGLAKVLTDEAGVSRAGPVSTAGGARLGTWEYMSPEQWIDSKNVDARADVYALGILTFQLLTGELPFVASQQKPLMAWHLFEHPPLERLEGRVPRAVREFLARMLDKAPEQRPTSREVALFITSVQ